MRVPVRDPVATSVTNVVTAIDLRLSPSLRAPSVYLQPHKAWLEDVLGCELVRTVILRLPVPYGDFIVEEFLKATPLARPGVEGDAGGADNAIDEEQGPWSLHPFAVYAPVSAPTTYVSNLNVWRSTIVRWECTPREPVELDAEPARHRSGDATSEGWSVQWRGPAFALWCKGLRHGIVFVSIPFVAFQAGGMTDDADICVLINAEERNEALGVLRSAFVAAPNVIQVIGGRNVRLADVPYDWNRLVLPANVLEQVRDDFEAFLCRRQWFIDNHVAYKRGYLLYGPPGNGKTSIIKLMAAHPEIRSFGLDFSNARLSNETLTQLSDVASRHQPSLVIFEDLDRLYSPDPSRRDEDNRTRITLQHVFNAIDSVGNREGVIVAATANDMASLDPGLAQRPGRFDRAIYIGPPDVNLRMDYLRRLMPTEPSDEQVSTLADGTEGFSFAHLTEMHFAAALAAFGRRQGDGRIDYPDLESAMGQVRTQMEDVERAGRLNAGFGRSGFSRQGPKAPRR